ncbi:MAG TPA: divergent polysaccharide deacetylase family protein [Stellaceae bacterium]|jgi:polysaccharide deacetylase 2 family uncharacterized protein YibQ|nr:divergent polysaccharide deacetylase family protein [Stellaceae bacterium]
MARKQRGGGKAGKKKWVLPVAGGALVLGVALLAMAIVPRFIASPDKIEPVAVSPAEQQTRNHISPKPQQPQVGDALAPLFRKATKAKMDAADTMSAGAASAQSNVAPDAPLIPSPMPSAPPSVMAMAQAPVAATLPPANLLSASLPPSMSLPTAEPAPHPVEAAAKHTRPEQVAALPPPPIMTKGPLPPAAFKGGEMPWQHNAIAVAPIAGRPMIAIVLDDMGVDERRSRLAVEELQAPITTSIMSYAKGIPALAAMAHGKGDELMLHMPMQPLNPKIDPGPNALMVGLSDNEIRRRLDWGLAQVGNDIVGVNNHMGSRFTEWPQGMRVVLEDLRQRGLFYLDSRTTPHAVGYNMAKAMGMPHVARDVFLDDTMTTAAVEKQLALTERFARLHGAAVAIGHPHDVTIAALRTWLPTLAAKGFAQVPITAIVRRNQAADHPLVQVSAPASSDSP